jgi:hypothetical protein
MENLKERDHLGDLDIDDGNTNNNRFVLAYFLWFIAYPSTLKKEMFPSETSFSPEYTTLHPGRLL